MAPDSYEYPTRRAVLGASAGTLSWLAGCAGDIGDAVGSTTDENDSDRSDTENASPDHPDFVIEADPEFGEITPDWEEGTATIDVRLDEIDDGTNAGDLVLVYRSRDIVAGPLGDGATGALPITTWGYQAILSGDGFPAVPGPFEIELRSESHDVLATMTWAFEPALEITGVEVNTDGGGSDREDRVSLELHNHGHVAYVREIELAVDPWDRVTTFERDELQSANEGDAVYGEPSPGRLRTLGLGSGTGVIALAGSTRLGEDGTCDAGDGEITVVTTDDQELAVDIAVVGGERIEDGEPVCDGAAISIDD